MPTRHQLSRYPDHVRAIGMIALETVDLELELSLLFSTMLGISYTVAEAIYMTPKNDQARLEVLKNTATALFSLHPKSKNNSPKSKLKLNSKKKVLKIVQRAQTCIGKRHRAMHDEWYVIPKTKEIKRLQVDGRGVVVGTPMPINELNREIEALRILIDDISKLADEFKKNPPTMTSTPIRRLYKTQ